mmetsp:Transcript_34186/g.54482  ORF Transcript_34186/g.54482 Transcript_34186/m.54482 type:complete len:299 (+) Transcript_34186:100-996(+)
MAEVPLPLRYPENLIHAQKMYALSIGQLLRVEQQINQLQSHLRERDLRRLASSATATALFAAVKLQGKESDFGHISVEVEARQQGGGIQAQAQRQEAAQEQEPQQPQEQHLRQHRQRLFNAVKIAFAMLFFEFSTGWFFVYFFGVVLYIGGVFDPIIHWFQRRPARVALEQQLNGLRNRQRDEERIAEQVEAERSENVERPAASTNADSPEKEDLVDPNYITANGSSSSSDAHGTDDGGLQESTEEPSSQTEAVAPPPAEGNAENVDQPPYWHCFIYQLFVMFFLTLLPWWNPDPRYL